MKKKAKTLIVLSAVLIVCIGAYVGVTVHNANVAKKESAETDTVRIYPSSWEAPLTIAYETAGSTLSFTREETTWYYDGDRDFPLKQTSVSSLSSALYTLSAIRAFDAPDDLSVYGLVAPAYKIMVSDNNGNPLTLLIGSMSGDNYYAMENGGGEIYTIDASLVGYLEPDILNMITLDTIPTLSESTIDRITLASGERSLILDKYNERDGSITWFIVEGAAYTSADDYLLSDGTESAAIYVANVLSALGGASFTSCAAFNPADDASFGLSAPELTVTVDYTATDSETSETAVLEIGQPLPDESGNYARLADSSQVNILSSDKTALLYEALEIMGAAR